MPDFTAWASDLLIQRGALVEPGGGEVRALLPPDLAAALEAPEWLSLRFGAGPGSDDEGDWLERFGRLLPHEARAAGARVRHPAPVPPLDAAAVLERELVIQNGVCRALDGYQTMARYFFFGFEYAIESDETSLGVATVCLNASASSLVSHPETLLAAVRDGLEDDPAFEIPRPDLERLFPIALHAALPGVRGRSAAVEESASRRLARDAARIHSYYQDLLAQIGQRMTRHRGDAPALEKERARAEATRLDREAKLEDLARKYALKIRLEPGDVLAVSLPVREIKARILRKKSERVAAFHWNPSLKRLEAPWCESCTGPAHPLWLCDDRLHFLCKSCLAPCPACGRIFCRACRPTCPGGPHAPVAAG
jgi:hypothetical protein